MYLNLNPAPLTGFTATSLAPRARAFGTIQDVAKANHVDAETVTISDGFGALIFEYDVTGNGVTAGHINVDISGATTAASVGVILAAAINNALTKHADGTDFAMTAVHVGTGLVYLWSNNFGTLGNVTITEAVTDGGYAVAGMSGAVDGVPLLRAGLRSVPGEGFDSNMQDLIFSLNSRSGSGTMTFSGRLWTYQDTPGFAALGVIPNMLSSLPAGCWAPHGIAVSADTDRGLLNGGVTVAESFTQASPSGDILQFKQAVGDMRHSSRVYLQVLTIGGTSPVLDAWLLGRV